MNMNISSITQCVYHLHSYFPRGKTLDFQRDDVINSNSLAIEALGAVSKQHTS